MRFVNQFFGSTGKESLIDPFSYIFDDYSGGFVGYSLKKLRTSYSGSCIKVRRSSDNTTMDIGFSGVALDVASLLSFVGAGNGFVEIWYDQSGNGYDISQSTTANQPQIVSSGSVFTDLNGKPTIYWNGTSHYLFRNSLNFNSYTHIFGLNAYKPVLGANAIPVLESNSGNNTPFTLWNYNQSSSPTVKGTVTNFFRADNNNSLLNQGNFTNNTRTVDAEMIVATRAQKGASSPIYLDGNNPISSIYTSGTITTNRLCIGATIRPTFTYSFKGHQNECLFWNTDQTGNESSIIAKTNDYYQYF